MKVWGKLYCIGVKIVMHYLETNLSGVIIITTVYVTMIEFHVNMRNLGRYSKNVYMYYFYHFNVVI